MFARQYFPAGYFGPEYWPTGTTVAPPPPVEHPTEAPGGGKRRRRRLAEPYVQLERPQPKPVEPEPVTATAAVEVPAAPVVPPGEPLTVPVRRPKRVPPGRLPAPSVEGAVLAGAPDLAAVQAALQEATDQRLRLLLLGAVSLS
jgi:hypothetical protein